MFACCTAAAKPPSPPSVKVMLSPERADFEVVFKNRAARNSMLTKVGADDSRLQTTLRLRFCAAADEYMDTVIVKERRQKARKIVCMFIQSGSMFELGDVPESFLHGLLGEKFELIPALREHYAELASKDPFVIGAVSASCH